ncbi:MAG: hypothetical protein R3E96_10135 [Planctomycetota bacterium]
MTSRTDCTQPRARGPAPSRAPWPNGIAIHDDGDVFEGAGRRTRVLHGDQDTRTRQSRMESRSGPTLTMVIGTRTNS